MMAPEVKDANILQHLSDLEILCRENCVYFHNSSSRSDQKLYRVLDSLANGVLLAKRLVCEIRSFVHEYDFDSSIPGNGYRSFITVTDSCIVHSLEICANLKCSRTSWKFQASWYTQEIESYETLLASLCSCMKYLLVLRQWSDPGNLFPNGIHSANELFAYGEPVNQLSFYGRCIGFQFCRSIKTVLQFISSCMAGFSESYFSKSNSVFKTMISVWSGAKYFLDPQLRAKRIVNIVQKADIDFCKAFWFLAEGEIMQRYASVIGESVQVNKVISIPPETLSVVHPVSGHIDVPAATSHFGPADVTVRLISSKRRRGMVAQYSCINNVLPPSKSLVIHCHGGGFVAQSSKSHEIYVRGWAAELDVPILSIDYSLAPQAPFPRALEEIFYVYCWVLKNCHLFGSLGEKIIMVGDSAGSNLNLAVTLKCIELGIRKPDGLFMAYCPFLVSFVPSPARLLCLMDPLLPFGFMMRCLKAYVASSTAAKEDNINRLDTLKHTIDAMNNTKMYILGMLRSNCELLEKEFTCKITDNDLLLHPAFHKTSFAHDGLAGVAKRQMNNSDSIQKQSQVEITPLHSDNTESITMMKNPASEFDFEVPKNPFISPYLADDEHLLELPSVKILSVEMDPCLDDCVMFAKKLRKLGVPITLDIVKGLPHGFLNLVKLSKEADNGARLCAKRIKDLLNE